MVGNLLAALLDKVGACSKRNAKLFGTEMGTREELLKQNAGEPRE